MPRRRAPIAITIGVVALLLIAFFVFVGLYADVLWYDQLTFLEVLTTQWAALAAMFPKVVDLNSIGNRSNAHAVANLAGLFLAVLSALPPIGLAVLARAVLDRPALTPILLLAWLAVAFAINRAAARPLRALLASRRENLALTVG